MSWSAQRISCVTRFYVRLPVHMAPEKSLFALVSFFASSSFCQKKQSLHTYVHMYRYLPDLFR